MVVDHLDCCGNPEQFVEFPADIPLTEKMGGWAVKRLI
jgi:hypothetical protein